MPLPCSSSEGRRLVAPIVTALHAAGARVRQIGVYPTAEGLLFVADVNGRIVSCATSAGTIVYQHVATALLAATCSASGTGEVHGTTESERAVTVLRQPGRGQSVHLV